MQIFIMRHGEASNQSLTSQNSDALRPLTASGEFESQTMGRWLSQLNNTTFDIYVSPYHRAQQTCFHVVKNLESSQASKDVKVTTLDFITPSGDVKQTQDFIDGLCCDKDSQPSAILIISHMPFVSYLVAQLTRTQNMPLFCTASIAHIDYNIDSMQGELVNMISPAQIA
jgi:phosphohistidine phosphatase